jgi:hypothetical protein
MSPHRYAARVSSLYATRDAEIIRRIRAGESMAKIARDHGISRSRGSQLAKTAGLKPQRWTRR